MSNREKNINAKNSSLRLVTLGIQSEAIIVFLLQIVRLFFDKTIIELAGVGLTFLAWVVIFVGMNQLHSQEKKYKKAWIASIVAPISIILGTMLVLKGIIQDGLGVDSFLDIKIAFFSYLAVLAMLYIFKKFFNEITNQAKLGRKWWIISAIVLGTLFLVPVMLLFPKIVTWIGTPIFAALGGLAKFYGCTIMKGTAKKMTITNPHADKEISSDTKIVAENKTTEEKKTDKTSNKAENNEAKVEKEPGPRSKRNSAKSGARKTVSTKSGTTKKTSTAKTSTTKRNTTKKGTAKKNTGSGTKSGTKSGATKKSATRGNTNNTKNTAARKSTGNGSKNSATAGTKNSSASGKTTPKGGAHAKKN